MRAQRSSLPSSALVAYSPNREPNKLHQQLFRHALHLLRLLGLSRQAQQASPMSVSKLLSYRFLERRSDVLPKSNLLLLLEQSSYDHHDLHSPRLLKDSRLWHSRGQEPLPQCASHPHLLLPLRRYQRRLSFASYCLAIKASDQVCLQSRAQ